MLTQEQVNEIVERRLAEDRARRERQQPAATPAPKAEATSISPLTEEAVLSLMARERTFTLATSAYQVSPQQLTRMEAAFRAEKPADVAAWTQSYIADMGFKQVTMQQPSTTTTPAPAVGSPEAAKPAAAPAAPVPHVLPTSGGLTDIWNLTPTQLDQLGPAGVRAELQKHWEHGQRINGAPQRPKPPQR
jgi:hypothetical protein